MTLKHGASCQGKKMKSRDGVGVYVYVGEGERGSRVKDTYPTGKTLTEKNVIIKRYKWKG